LKRKCVQQRIIPHLPGLSSLPGREDVVLESGCGSLRKLEAFITLANEEESSVRSDFGTLEVDGNPPVEAG
jgi:hypothetical protein